MDAIQVRLSEHDRRFVENNDEHDQIWNVLNKVRDRLPPWAVLIIGFLAGGLGTCVGILGTIIFR